MVTVALLAGGHVLLEGPPGTAKTLLAQAFARAVGLDYGRIQFTPDLMPGDILGSNLFNFQTSSFTLTKGPIFTELLLADEINRSEEHTSELQSLMRISYAVFCLKKKTENKIRHNSCTLNIND